MPFASLARPWKWISAVCAEGLNGFGGVGRRFEFKGEKGGVTVVDDYGHHPAEIAATLATARQVFPSAHHSGPFSRTVSAALRPILVNSARFFDNVDQLLLTEIYAASENPSGGFGAEPRPRVFARFPPRLWSIFKRLTTLPQACPIIILKEGDVLLTLALAALPARPRVARGSKPCMRCPYPFLPPAPRCA